MEGDWNAQEVEAAVADYFEMLAKELRSEPFNKAEHNRNLRKVIARRTAGSIERKHQNISAVLILLGFPYIKGYKPFKNFQHLLGSVVEARLNQAVHLKELASSVVTQTTPPIPPIGDFSDLCVSPPVRDELQSRIYETRQFMPQGTHLNYLELEASNRSLGAAGEEFVIQLEHRRLWIAGKHSLAERIEHVSKTKGDGLGYDILSFEESGKERLIEVKTTSFGQMTPFFLSRNELLASKALSDLYQLYRVFSFRKDPRLYTLRGSLQDCCELEPVNYSAFPQ
ncbi:DUF3883 domain-containing protein [Roseimicrobium sp. ORNL1]|uniref:protein NO VEIN domain-containing protein n=1 Tax=Roseimicrobium sp. ORNL1 TaxID=2711231 RepID=UPI0013E19C14|nr:DUF3883 domain-containing protein [Roseimicrobium sp. ORNL1]QIF04808.1 DUF3883 domain-containing protein [Roseimicrobium sp. ORNL1]